MAGIKGAESMSAEQIVREIDRGAKVVVFDYCISILVLTFSRKSDPIFIPHGNGTFGAALPYIVCSFLFGWWGFPFGLIYTPLAIAKNLGGGTDVSQMVRAQLT